jgi:NAD(P)-dependent dehydrogenase (short-subunit alcohol dehydrogenase family)
MSSRTWLITGVSSGFGHALTTQLLERGETVIGTVRDLDKAADLREQYPDTFRAEILDVTDTAAVRKVVDAAFAADRVDVIVSNAGYGLFGAAEEVTDAQVDHIIATNLTGSITLIRAALPHLRAQGGGRSCRCPPTAARSPSPATPCTTPPSGASKGSPSRSHRRSPRSASA